MCGHSTNRKMAPCSLCLLILSILLGPLLAIPTSLCGQYSTKPKGGGPSATPTQTTNTPVLAGHPASLLSPAPTTTKRQAGSVKDVQASHFQCVMSHSKTFSPLLSSMLFLIIYIICFFLLVKQSLTILKAQVSLGLSIPPLLLQVLGLQAGNTISGRTHFASKVMHSRLKETSRASEMAQ